jgi:nucleoside-diphosphate-sugar epimerase
LRVPPTFPRTKSSQECTLDTSRAREELGYAPVKTREEGLAEMRAEGR